MRDLTEASGLPKSTILHYVNAGLLPPPLKTSPNMAYYDPICLEKLKLIKELQIRHRLPLVKIKAVLEVHDQGQDLAPLIELNREIFGQGGETVDLAGLCRETGLSPESVAEMEAAGLLLPLAPGRYDQEDVAMGRLLVHGLGLGLKPAEMSFYHRLAEELVTAEMDLRQRLTQALPLVQDALLTLRLTQAARATRAYVIDRVFQRRVLAMKSLKEGGPECPTC